MDVAQSRGRPDRVLSHAEARAFYDRFWRKQDLQRIYPDPAIEVLLHYAGFETACAVVVDEKPFRTVGQRLSAREW